MKTLPLPVIFMLLAAASALLSSCVSNPQTRIESNPAIYNGLSKSHKGIASQGRITEGMSPEAVFIAWGKPDSIKTSSDRGQITETWLYRGSEPVYTHSSHFGYGYYGHHYGHGHFHPNYCHRPSVYYRSYIAGKVTFRNRRVTQWEITGR